MTYVVKKRRLHIAAFTSSLGAVQQKIFCGDYRTLLQKQAFLWQQGDAGLPA